MRILRKNRKEGKVKLLIDTIDDLWYLSTLVDEGDLVSAVTFRRGDVQTDIARDKRAEKKRMFLTLEVEKVEFHEFTDHLRIMGVITAGPQDHGQHHTFDMEPGSDLVLQKDRWHPHHWERLREAREASKMPILTFVSIDDETATVAVLRPQGLQVLANINSYIQGKRFDHGSKGDKEAFFDEIIMMLEHHMERAEETGPTLSPVKGEGDKETPATARDVIVLGPGFFKEEFVQYAREKGVEANFAVESASQAGKGGIREVLRSGVSKALEKAKASEDERYMERLFAEISKDGRYTYGHDEVLRALEMGAAEIVLMTEDFLRDPKMETVGELAKRTRAEVRVLSTGYDAGSRLEALGGLAALLRWSIEDPSVH